METRPETGGSLRSILLVEDDTELCSLMNDFLLPQGFRLEAVYDGRQGLARALAGDFDLVILDVMLPDQNGLDTARHLRRDSYVKPILMLTVRILIQSFKVNVNQYFVLTSGRPLRATYPRPRCF